MFNPKILSVLHDEDRMDQKELEKIHGGSPGCSSWWDSNSECKHAKGCITASWTSIEKPKR